MFGATKNNVILFPVEVVNKTNRKRDEASRQQNESPTMTNRDSLRVIERRGLIRAAIIDAPPEVVDEVFRVLLNR